MNELVRNYRGCERNNPTKSKTLHFVPISFPFGTPQAKKTEEELSESELLSSKKLVQEHEVRVVQKFFGRFHTRKVFFLHRTRNFVDWERNAVET